MKSSSENQRQILRRSVYHAQKKRERIKRGEQRAASNDTSNDDPTGIASNENTEVFQALTQIMVEVIALTCRVRVSLSKYQRVNQSKLTVRALRKKGANKIKNLHP